MLILELKVTPTPFSLRLPDLVVMILAPAAARLPYKAVAPGPFNTVTLSISSGLISDTSEPKSTGLSAARWALKPVPVILLLTGTPSITINAWLLSKFRDDSPRNVMRDEPIGPEPVLVIFKPATLPVSELTQLLVFASLTAFSFTVWAA